MFCKSLSRMACLGVVAPPPDGWVEEAVVVGVWEGKAAAVTGLWEVSDPPPLPLVPGEDWTRIGLQKISKHLSLHKQSLFTNTCKQQL